MESLDKGHGDNWDYAMTIPNRGKRFDANTLKGSQFQEHPHVKVSSVIVHGRGQ